MPDDRLFITVLEDNVAGHAVVVGGIVVCTSGRRRTHDDVGDTDTDRRDQQRAAPWTDLAGGGSHASLDQRSPQMASVAETNMTGSRASLATLLSAEKKRKATGGRKTGQ